MHHTETLYAPAHHTPFTVHKAPATSDPLARGRHVFWRVCVVKCVMVCISVNGSAHVAGNRNGCQSQIR